MGTHQRNTEGALRANATSWIRTRPFVVIATALAFIGLFGTTGAYAYASSGWVNGPGQAAGTGLGLVLPNFYTVGVGAYNQKWLGAYNASTFMSGGGGEVWCIEAGIALPPGQVGYGNTVSGNVRDAYALFLADHQWNTADGRAAVQYTLYQQYPTLGENWSFAYDSFRSYPGDGSNDGGRVWLHPDLTSTARSLIGQFQGTSDAQLHNTVEHLTFEHANVVPDTGTLSNIGVTDPWGAHIPGLPYTIAISGPGVFDSTGTNTVSGSTTGASIQSAHPWHATGDGTVHFTITYPGANAGSNVTQWTNGSYQDFVTPRVSDLTWFADPVAVSTGFTPSGVTNAQNPTVAVGDDLVDNFTVPASTPWGYDGGAKKWVPVTFDVSLYFVGESPANAPSATAPVGMTPIATRQVTVTDPDVAATVNFGPATQPGAYAYVWEFHIANQPPAYSAWWEGSDWTDQYGLLTETTVAQFPGAISTTLDSVIPGAGAPRELGDDITITGFPADHGTFLGGAPFTADAANITHTLYFFPAGLAVTDANLPSATVVGTPATTPAINGSYPNVRNADWVVAQDANSNEVPGTYVVVSSFAGDSRVPAIVTSATDANEKYDVTVTPLSLATTASSAAALVADDSVSVWDGATISGYTPVGATIEYALYALNDASAPICDASTLVRSVAAAPLSAVRTYESAHIDVLVPRGAALAFVAIVRDQGGTVLAEGSCGEASETLSVVPDAATTAHSTSGPTLTAGDTSTLWDTADVWGDLPSGTTATFELYQFDDPTAPVCDASTLLKTTASQPVAGVSTITSPTITTTVARTAALGFVVVIRDAGGTELVRGACGAPTETLNVQVGSETDAKSSQGGIFGIGEWFERGSTAEAWDTGTLWGTIEPGSTIGFDLYAIDDPSNPVCSPGNVVASVAPTAVTGVGSFVSSKVTLKVPATAALGWVETVYSAGGDVTYQGRCGAGAETIRVVASGYGIGGAGIGLAFTGFDGDLRWLLIGTGILVLAGAALTALAFGRRRA